MRGPTVSARGFCRPGSLVPMVQMLSPGPVPPFGAESAPGEELPQERHTDENGCELLCFCRLEAAMLLSRHVEVAPGRRRRRGPFPVCSSSA